MMNKPPRDVREDVVDRRVLRTRRALGAALVELMTARDFDTITVQQVLDRARVGRATFYAHFRNKNDLLLSDAERYLHSLERNFLAEPAGSRRLAPVAELFGHVAEYHHFRGALEKSELREPVYDLLTGHLAQIIARRMDELSAGGRTSGLPATATARLLAAAMVEMMRWWLGHPGTGDAGEMDAQFHAIAWNGLARTVHRAP